MLSGENWISLKDLEKQWKMVKHLNQLYAKV